MIIDDNTRAIANIALYRKILKEELDFISSPNNRKKLLRKARECHVKIYNIKLPKKI